jgi:hypothetical protein
LGSLARHWVNSKFFYQQTHKAHAMDDAFLSVTRENEALFELPVTRTWLRQVTVTLPLMGRGSYRGGIEFTRHLPGIFIGMGTVRHVPRSAMRQACVINCGQDLSAMDSHGTRIA